MENIKSATNAVGILSEINGRFAAISAKQFIAPLQQREKQHVAVGEAGHKIKRLYTLQHMLDLECQKLSPQKDADAFAMKVDLCDIVGRLFRNEILRQYPVFVHKPFVFCSDWTLCLDTSIAETGDLFRFAEPKEVASKSKNTVSTGEAHLGGVLNSSA
ncbi:MAG: hypothetical protein NUV90_01880 [Candidatus Parcubacteria bacterium]|nr:hypothetical protein [Candidatus Parcubacteria bacterium]